jgi:hypothetical protein
MKRVFLLSPASCSGQRARLVLNGNARFDLAQRLRSAEGAPLGEVFSFLSGLYFRGKLAYARLFARPPSGGSGVLIITLNEGLLPHDTSIQLAKLREFGHVPINKDNELYHRSLLRAAQRLAVEVGRDCDIVLLGSIASGKYLDILAPVLGHRLSVPAEFIGRGDMSRGGLMLRCVKEQRELDYIRVNGMLFRGPRPPKLLSDK